ncbi:MAG: hypothetical protein ABI431_03365 [Candidatus Tumulicola sp.]
MTYVEWLRVGAALKRTAITLGILVAIAIAARIWVAYYGPVDALSYVSSVRHDPSSHVAVSTLPDGSQRTVIDNPAKQVHLEVTDRGHGDEIVRIVRSSGAQTPLVFGDADMHRSTHGGQTDVTIETNREVLNNSTLEFGIAGFIALIVGMILAGSFARENDGHLEIALTKPVSRTELSIRIMLVDIAGIVAAWVLGVLATYIVHALFLGFHFGVTVRDCQLAVAVILGAIAWYALLCCATASLKRNYGIILGTAWIAGQLIPVLAHIPRNAPPLLGFLRVVATPLSWIDPFTYARISVAMPSETEILRTYPYAVEIPVLVALTIAYALCAIVQWRRVEA